MSSHTLKVVVASDVSVGRDGIGEEIYLDGELLVVVFRDDAKRKREVSLYKEDVPIEIVEEAIAIFKREVPWDYLEYESADSSGRQV